MEISQLNNSLRKLFEQLIEQGYNKHSMCRVTLGSSFNPQFNKFMQGTDLGLNPLTRMIEGLGYKLHLIPIKDDDAETQKMLDNQYSNFIENSKNSLMNFLDNQPAKARSTQSNEEVSQIVDEFMGDILPQSNSNE